MSADDEENALLALQHHDRVRHIDISEPGLQKLFAILDKPFPMLQGLRLAYLDLNCHSRLPQTFVAPYLRHLELVRIGDVRLHLLASITGLVTLTLEGIPASTFLPVEYLMSRLSLMPQLEYLHLNFLARTSSDRILSEPSEPATPPVSFPNLDEVVFKGAITYLESLTTRIRVPHLTRFTATLFYQSFFPLSSLSEFLVAARELRFPVAFVKFMDPGDDPPEVSVYMADSEQTLGQSPESAPFRISLTFPPLDRQLVLVGRLCAALAPMLSTVKRLHVSRYATNWQERCLSPEIKRAMWHNLLRPFRNVEKLRVEDALVEELSLALCPDDGPSMEILPELSKLALPDFARVGKAFDGFIAGRKAAGRPITKCPLISASDDEDLDNK